VNDKIMTPGCHRFAKADGIPTQMVVLRNSGVCHRYRDEGWQSGFGERLLGAAGQKTRLG